MVYREINHADERTASIEAVRRALGQAVACMLCSFG
jgi:hypothetical protein